MVDTIVHSEGNWRLRATTLESGERSYTIEVVKIVLHVGNVDAQEAKDKMSEIMNRNTTYKKQIGYNGV